MSDAALQRLLTWLSPAFPVGSFAWSQGLETAITDRRIASGPALREWIEGSIAHGGMRTDAIILTHAHMQHSDTTALRDLSDLALALTPSSERHLETTLTGEAFAAFAFESKIRVVAACFSGFGKTDVVTGSHDVLDPDCRRDFSPDSCMFVGVKTPLTKKHPGVSRDVL